MEGDMAKKGGKISYHVFENTGCGDALRMSMPM